jgi:DNA-binding PadR family transcriptional regulator
LESLGSFEQLLLFAVLQLGEGAYGVTIRETLEATAGKTASFGAIYTALARLEERGLVTSWVGVAVTEQRGRPPKFYKVSREGARALLAAYSALQSVSAGLLPALTRLAEGKQGARV